MIGQRILLVEPDEELQQVIATMLAETGFVVSTATTAAESLNKDHWKFDLAIVELELPDEDGLVWISEMRRWSSMSIVVLSGRDTQGERVLPLKLGADDVMVKPINLLELRERVHAVLRRTTRPTRIEPVSTFGALTLDNATIEAIHHGQSVHLTPIEFKLLRDLGTHLGEVVTKDALVERVWEYPSASGTGHLIDVHMGRLKAKLSQIGARHLIRTEYGRGLMLVDEGSEF